MLNKKIILTFDYELFFYKSGTVENSMLKPTALFIEKSRELGIKGIFFVDVLFLQKLKECSDLQAIYSDVEDQLKLLVKEGHRLELHLHSHWLDAYYNGEEWIYPTYKHYSLHSLSPKVVSDLFKNGTEYLNSIAGEVEPGYRVNAFRAGGWCIQPFSPLKEVFRENGITIESSAAFGIKGHGDVHSYDFRNIPDKEYYYFKDDINKEERGDFIEFPITVYKKSLLSKLLKLRSKDNFSYFGDGQGIPMFKSLFGKILEKLQSTKVMFSIDVPDVDLLIKKLGECDKKIVTFISHPKFMNSNSLILLEKLKKSGCQFLQYNDVLEENI